MYKCILIAFVLTLFEILRLFSNHPLARESSIEGREVLKTRNPETELDLYDHHKNHVVFGMSNPSALEESLLLLFSKFPPPWKIGLNFLLKTSFFLNCMTKVMCT